MQFSEGKLSSPPEASACSRVPVDILHEIIPYCLPLYPTIRSANDVMSTLSRVSSSWRAAVLSSTGLRSRLLVTLQKNDDLERCARRVTQWLQHTHSLSFFLNIDFKAHHEDIARIRTFLVDLSSVMSRVRHFALHSRLTTELLRSFIDLEWNLPRLQILDLFSHDVLDANNAIAYDFPLFHNAQNLVEVAIGNAITWDTDIVHLLPWSQLTRIHLKYETSISRWIEVMNMCPKMRFCRVTIHEDYYSPPCSPSGIHHSLERLFIDICDGSVPFLKLLTLYQLPSLHTLAVHYHEEPHFNFPCPQGISALAKIRYFSFNKCPGMTMPHEHISYLAEILREMDNLMTLQLQQTTEEFIPLYEALSFNRPEDAILPRLEILRLWVSPVSHEKKDMELQPLLGMLSSRSRKDNVPVGFKPLKTIIVGVATENIHERMRKLFDPWVGGLPSQLRFSIDLDRSTCFHKPKGWTQPISNDY